HDHLRARHPAVEHAGGLTIVAQREHDTIAGSEDVACFGEHMRARCRERARSRSARLMRGHAEALTAQALAQRDTDVVDADQSNLMPFHQRVSTTIGASRAIATSDSASGSTLLPNPAHERLH